MSKRAPLAAGLAVLCLSLTAGADIVPMASRGITLDQKEIQMGFDFTLGLNSGQVGEAWSFGHGVPDGFIALDRNRNPGAYPAMRLTGYEHQRHAGFRSAFGILDELEVGFALNAFNFTRIRDAQGHVNNSAELGGAEIHATWAFLPFLGVELGFLFPAEDWDENRIGVRLGIPILIPLVEDLFTITLREDLEFYFVKGGPTIQTFTDLGLTVSPLPEFFMEMFVGFRYGIHRPHGDARLPLGLKLGITPVAPLDLGITFVFGDLLDHGADARSLGLSGSFRY